MAVRELVNRKRRQIVRVASSHGGLSVRVFGSAARGDTKPGSDVDILLRLEPGRTLLDLVAIKQDLEDLLGCSVDVLTEAAISPYIREQVLKEAISL